MINVAKLKSTLNTFRMVSLDEMESSYLDSADIGKSTLSKQKSMIVKINSSRNSKKAVS